MTNEASEPEKTSGAGELLGPTGRMLLAFLLVVVAGLALLRLEAVEHGVMTPWTKLNAQAAAGLLNLVGFDAFARSTLVSAGRAAVDVRHGCDGAHALLLFVAAVAASPVSWPRRGVGILAGIVAILGFNQLRLVNLVLVSLYRPTLLEFFHVYVWQVLIVLLMFGTFLVWGYSQAGLGPPVQGRS
jgi:exosortase/archaeosortase family protein